MRNHALDVITGWRPIADEPAQVGTRWALGITSSPTKARGLTTGQRMTLLAMGMAADVALHAPNGYQGFRPDEIAAITGISVSTARSHLAHLAQQGLVTAVNRAGSYFYRISEQAFQ